MNQVELRNKLNKELKNRLTVIITEDYSFYYHYKNGELLKEIIYYNQMYRNKKWLVINLDYSRKRIYYL